MQAHLGMRSHPTWAQLFADAGDIVAVGGIHDDLKLSQIGGCSGWVAEYSSLMAATRQRINMALVP